MLYVMLQTLITVLYPIFSWYFLSPVICYSLVSWSVATGTSTVWVVVEFRVVVVPGPFTSVVQMYPVGRIGSCPMPEWK